MPNELFLKREPESVLCQTEKSGSTWGARRLRNATFFEQLIEAGKFGNGFRTAFPLRRRTENGVLIQNETRVSPINATSRLFNHSKGWKHVIPAETLLTGRLRNALFALHKTKRGRKTE